MKFYFAFFLSITGAVVFGQHIAGDTIACTDGTMELTVEGITEKSGLTYEYDWSFNENSLKHNKKKFRRKKVNSSHAGKYNCNVRITDDTKAENDSLFIILNTVVSVMVEVQASPKSEPMPGHTLVGDDLNLHVARNEKELVFSWLGPDGDKYDGAVVSIPGLGIRQVGKYQLIITDTSVNCTTTVPFDVGTKNEVKKPANIFGTIDENTGLLVGLLREAQRDFPIYPVDILGVETGAKYDIAELGTIWQIIGELDNAYLIEYLPSYIAIEDRKLFYKRFYELVKNTKQLERKVEELTNEWNRSTSDSLRTADVYQQLLVKSRSMFATADTIKSLFLNYQKNIAFRYGEYLPLDEFKNLFEGLADDGLESDNIEDELFDDLEARMTSRLVKKRYFKVDRADFEIRARPFKFKSLKKRPEFTAGTIIIPVKVRFSDFQFSKDITLGPYFGGKWLISNYNPNYFSFGLTTGITSVTLLPRDVGSASIMEAQDVSAFTLALGGILEFNRVQLGIFAGLDWINNNKGDSGIDWNYQRKPWLSFGLGYSIISRPASAKGNKRDPAN